MIAINRRTQDVRFFVLVVRCLCLVTLFFMDTAYLWAAEATAHSDRDSRVLVLYSTARDFPATEIVEQGLAEGLASGKRLAVQLFSEYLDLSRFRDSQQRKALADLLRQRYSSGQIDLVIGVDVPAATFLMENETLFSTTPILLCSIPETLQERIYASSLQGRVTGVFEPTFVLRGLVDSILQFKPATKHVVLVSGAYENDQVRAAALRQPLAALQDKVELIDLSGQALGSILEKCEQLPADSVILYSTFFVDANGRNFIPRAVLQSIAAHTEAPILGPYESYMGNGIIGGTLISLRLQGKRAAEMALRFLQGQSPPQYTFYRC